MREMGCWVSEKSVIVKNGAGLGAVRRWNDRLHQSVRPSTLSWAVSVLHADVPQTLAWLPPLAAAAPLAISAAPTAQIQARFITMRGM